MMRYIGCAWDPLNDESRTAVETVKGRVRLLGPCWTSVIDEPGLFVACVQPDNKSDISVLPARLGVLIGAAFSGATRCNSAVDLDIEFTHELRRTGGRAMTARLWGSYVMFLRDPVSRTTYTFRAPMAQLPCYYISFSGVSVSFSSIEDLESLALVNLTINWEVVRAQATNRDYLTRETALHGVTSLECGECLVVTPESLSVRVYWSPPLVARSSRIDDFESATATLSAVTRKCVSAWASRHTDILHTLSGGIDSSIVLACLRSAPSAPRICCLNQYTHGHIGDERQFARSMALKCDVPLFEVQRNPDAPIKRFLECVRTVRPVLHFSGIDCYSAYVSQARAVGASAIFDGELGDNVFGFVSGHEVVGQSIRERFAPLRTLSVALDFALLRRRSVWAVLSGALCDNRRRSKMHYWSMHDYMQQVMSDSPATGGFISAEALADYEANIERHIHPWFLDIEGVPYGLFGFFFALFTVTSSSYHQPFAQRGDPATVSPLISQPLVDASLCIDMPLHIRGGLDRAVARAAFKDDLSNMVLLRRGKGSPSGWIDEVVRRNRSQIREMLLDGVLVKERILDRKKLETVLSATAVNSPLRVTDVFLQLYIECWTQQWVRPKAQIAA